MGKLLCQANATAIVLPNCYQMPRGQGPHSKNLGKTGGKSTGELGFEANILILASHRNCVENVHFLGVFCEFYTNRHCTGIGLALAIFAEELQKIRKPLSARS
jgi:hypothetical protein